MPNAWLALLAVGITAAPGFAQNCVGPLAGAQLRSGEPYVANFFLSSPCIAPCTLPPSYTGAGVLFDLDVATPVTILGLEVQLYDEGVPGTTRNQVGNLGEARVYVCPSSWTGQATLRPGSPGATWTLAATGTYVVTAFPAGSPITVAPFLMPAGRHGVLIELAPTSTTFHAANVNPGAVHPLLELNPPPLQRDAFLEIGNRSAQSQAFFSNPVGTLGGNFGIAYVPPAQAAYWLRTGAGCASTSVTLEATNRPTLGTTVQLTTTGQPTGTTGVFTAIGFADLPGGMTLDHLGMPGCVLRVGSFDWLFLAAANPAGSSAALALPGSPALAGLPLFAQSAALVPGVNPAGLVAGNGLCLRLH